MPNLSAGVESHVRYLARNSDALTYSLLVHAEGRPEYMDDRWSSNCFATLLEFMMTTSWPSSRQYTMGPVKDRS